MDTPLDRYLDEARAAERVLEDEPALLQSARSGDGEARKAVVRAYLYRTAQIALRLAPQGMGKLDAVQEANMVLLRLVTQPGPAFADELEAAIRTHFATGM